MFDFYVVLAGDDKITDTGRAGRFRCKLKAPSLQTKSAKNEGHFENMGFIGKQFEDFIQKKHS